MSLLFCGEISYAVVIFVVIRIDDVGNVFALPFSFVSDPSVVNAYVVLNSVDPGVLNVVAIIVDRCIPTWFILQHHLQHFSYAWLTVHPTMKLYECASLSVMSDPNKTDVTNLN